MICCTLCITFELRGFVVMKSINSSNSGYNRRKMKRAESRSPIVDHHGIATRYTTRNSSWRRSSVTGMPYAQCRTIVVPIDGDPYRSWAYGGHGSIGTRICGNPSPYHRVYAMGVSCATVHDRSGGGSTRYDRLAAAVARAAIGWF